MLGGIYPREAIAVVYRLIIVLVSGGFAVVIPRTPIIEAGRSADVWRFVLCVQYMFAGSAGVLLYVLFNPDGFGVDGKGILIACPLLVEYAGFYQYVCPLYIEVVDKIGQIAGHEECFPEIGVKPIGVFGPCGI